MQVLRKEFVLTGVLLAATSGFAQLASHAPTAVATAKTAPATAMTASPDTPQPTGKAVARVNNVVLTDRDLLQKMYAIFPYAQQHNGGFPKAMEQDIRHGAMKMIVFEELCYQEATARGMKVSSARIDKAVAEIKADMKSPGEYRMFLAQEAGGSEAQMRLRIQRMLLIQDIMQQEITSKSALTAAQVRAYYDQHTDKFKVAEQVSFQTISIVPPANSSAAILAEARKHAQDVWKQAKATKSYDEFGLLAEKVSDDDFRVNMGYRKPVDVSKLPKNIASILTSMKPGDISELVEIDGGFTILRLKEHTLPTTVPFATVKPELQKYLQKQKQEDLRSALNEKLRAKAKVEEL